MEGLTIGQLTQGGAWGLGLGTAFFSFLGLRADKDFFLVLGLICCIFGDFGFAAYLSDQGRLEEGEEWDEESGMGSGGGWVKSNETVVTLFVVLGVLSLYALYNQWNMYRLEGCNWDDEDEDGEEEETLTPAQEQQQNEVRAAVKDLVRQRTGGSASTASPSTAASSGKKSRKHSK